MKSFTTNTAQKFFAHEKIRFLLVGGFNTLFGFALFSFIQFSIGHTITYLGSLLLSHALASIVAFNLYRRFVFRVSGNAWHDFWKFQTVYIVPLVVNALLLPFFVSLLRWNVYYSQAIATILLTIGSYLGHKFFSFRRKSNE